MAAALMPPFDPYRCFIRRGGLRLANHSISLAMSKRVDIGKTSRAAGGLSRPDVRRSTPPTWMTLLIGVLATCALICVSAFAGDQGSRFDISPDGARVDFDLRDAPRRDVLKRLFAGTDVEIRWI